MWQLIADIGDAWITLGSYESVTTAAQKIIELESYPVSGVFFEVLIETAAGTEKEAFDHLEHTGRSTGRMYVVKSIRN